MTEVELAAVKGRSWEEYVGHSSINAFMTDLNAVSIIERSITRCAWKGADDLSDVPAAVPETLLMSCANNQIKSIWPFAIFLSRGAM